MELGLVRQCRGDAFVVYSREMLKLDMGRCAALLRRYGYSVFLSGPMLSATQKGKVLTLYPSGRMLISPCMSRDEAISVASNVFKLLE